MLYNWVVHNTKKKMNLEEIVKWFGDKCTILECSRLSDRGKSDKVYVVGASSNYGNILGVYMYVTDTGKGYGGHGRMKIFSIYDGKNIKKDSDRRTVWVFK